MNSAPSPCILLSLTNYCMETKIERVACVNTFQFYQYPFPNPQYNLFKQFVQIPMVT